MSAKPGPVTLLSVVQTGDGHVRLLAAQGECVPGSVLEIGNTKSRYRFPVGATRFLKERAEQGPAHHMAVGIGHVADTAEKLASILGIQFVKAD